MFQGSFRGSTTVCQVFCTSLHACVSVPEPAENALCSACMAQSSAMSLARCPLMGTPRLPCINITRPKTATVSWKRSQCTKLRTSFSVKIRYSSDVNPPNRSNDLSPPYARQTQALVHAVMLMLSPWQSVWHPCMRPFPTPNTNRQHGPRPALCVSWRFGSCRLHAPGPALPSSPARQWRSLPHSHTRSLGAAAAFCHQLGKTMPSYIRESKYNAPF